MAPSVSAPRVCSGPHSAPAGVSPLRVSAPLLSVIVVNYRCWADTERLVWQLLKAACVQRGQAEVVVVDNHVPNAGRPRSWLRRCPAVALRRWGRNRGFARAANEGGRLSRGQWLLFLNPDMSVPEGFLDAALAQAQTYPGIVGFRLQHVDGTPQGSSGPFPTLLGTLLRLFLPRARRKYGSLSDRRRPVPWVTGCCLLCSRTCFLDLDGFDPDYFLYYEDVDLCRRARARGWPVWYEPCLQLVHHHPLHTRRVAPPLRLYTRHALLTYASKHWPAWQLRLLAGVVWLEAGVRQLLARSDRRAAAIHRQLRLLAAELGRQQRRRARRRLERVVRSEEERLGPAAVDRHSESQPARPAGRVPGQPATACTVRDGSAGGR